MIPLKIFIYQTLILIHRATQIAIALIRAFMVT